VAWRESRSIDNYNQAAICHHNVNIIGEEEEEGKKNLVDYV
jgi:hypothetical protein